MARDPRDAGWELERVSTDNGSEFRNRAFDAELARLGVVHTLISPGPRREFERYLALYNHDRAHNGRLTRGRTPAEVLGAARTFR